MREEPKGTTCPKCSGCAECACTVYVSVYEKNNLKHGKVVGRRQMDAQDWSKMPFHYRLVKGFSILAGGDI